MLDPDSIRTLLVLLLLVLFSAYFSATETAFSSFNRIRIKNLAENGDKRAIRVQQLAEQYDRLLSTTLVGNNIVNILLTTLATVFFVRHFGQNKGATVATVVTTVVVLIFGEISPKSLAKDRAEGFAMATAPLLQSICVILYPFTALFSLWQKLLDLLFRSRQSAAVTEEELLTIVEEAEQGGSLNEQESDLIRNVLLFSDRTAGDILTPRIDVTGIDAAADREEMLQAFAATRYSRLPVYEESIDRILGVLHLKNALSADAADTAQAVMQTVIFVPPTMPIRLLLTEMQQKKTQMAVVADEYGGTMGIVTMEDILEELVGDIWDEHDDVVEPVRQTVDGSWLVLCSTELSVLTEHFGTETACESATVSGWVMEMLGRIPAEGDTFEADGLSVTVTRMDANRPEEIAVRPFHAFDEKSVT